MFDTILVPVDLSERDDRTLEVARDLAVRFGAEVTLLHVIETLDLPWNEVEDFYERLHERATAALDERAARLAGAGAAVVVQIVYGKRAAEIVGFAEENPVDLVVLSSRRLDLDDPEPALGSISHQVALMSGTPVLLVKRPPDVG